MTANARCHTAAAALPVLAANGPGPCDVRAVALILTAAIQQYHVIPRYRLQDQDGAKQGGTNNSTTVGEAAAHTPEHQAACLAATCCCKSAATLHKPAPKPNLSPQSSQPPAPAAQPTLSFLE